MNYLILWQSFLQGAIINHHGQVLLATLLEIQAPIELDLGAPEANTAQFNDANKETSVLKCRLGIDSIN